MSDGIRFRDCACPGTPHREEGDQVFLLPHLDFEAGAKANRLIMAHLGSTDEIAEHLGPHYLRNAIAGWNLWDEDGPIAFDAEALVGLPYWEALPIVEACDNAFSERILDPFRKRIESLSPNGRTASSSTSATRKSPRRLQARSAPSSPNGSAGSLR